MNDTPNVITRVSIFYTGEQWRFGGSSTTNRLRFSYAIGGASINDGDFAEMDALTFTSPITTGATGALNGNAAANRVLVSGTLAGLSWAPGQTFVIRWTDENDSGNDNGLAIDDLVLTTDAGTGPLEITSTTPDDGAIAAYPNSNITIRFNHPTVVTGAWYQVVGSVSGVHAATVCGPAHEPRDSTGR